MKIRITDKGFANLTGLFGNVEFVDGVSVDSVSRAEAARLGTILSIEVEGTGENPSTTQLMVDIHNKNMEELGLREANLYKSVPGVVQPGPEVIDQTSITTQKTSGAVVRSELNYDYTQDDLAAIADREGIAGLRAFADKYSLNDKSVAGLVKKLMNLKAEFAKPAQVEPVVEEEAPELTEEQKVKLAELEALGLVGDEDLTEEEKIAKLAEIEAAAKAVVQE